MEQRFGHDFSRVRVHSGAAAEQSARDVNANAYTVGHNIVFGAGRFAPGTHEGRRLIAHELTHVVQQSGANGIRTDQSNGKRGLSPVYAADAKTGQEAGLAAQQNAKGGDARITHSEFSTPLVQRQSPSSTGGRGTKLALNLPKQQLKAIGNPDINAIVEIACRHFSSMGKVL